MNHYENLNNSSGAFLVAGNFLCKFRYVLLPPFGIILNMSGLFLVMIGYLLWTAAGLIAHSSDLPHKKCEWGKLIQNYNIASAILGALASVSCLLFVINPLFFFGGMCLYIPSQVAFLCGEYHKYKKMQTDRQRYSLSGQIASIVYAGSSLLFTLLFAASCAACIIVVELAFPIMVISVCMGAILAAVMLFSYIQSDIKANAELDTVSSYQNILSDLDYSSDSKNSRQNSEELNTETDSGIDNTCQKRKSWTIVPPTLSRNTHESDIQDDEQREYCCIS